MSVIFTLVLIFNSEQNIGWINLFRSSFSDHQDKIYLYADYPSSVLCAIFARHSQIGGDPRRLEDRGSPI